LTLHNLSLAGLVSSLTIRLQSVEAKGIGKAVTESKTATKL
jgi:hypothetical protein